MPDDTHTDDSQPISVRDMRNWMNQEIADAAKALEMRLKDISNLVASYSAGEVTPEQAEEMQSRYYHRWGESLFGATVGDGIPDEQILAKIDLARGPLTSPHVARERYRRLLETTKNSTGQSH
jgi:hypothetical protein